MLPQHGQYNIAQIIFLTKVVCWPWTNIEQVNTLCNIAQEATDNIAQEKILFNVVLIFLGQHCTGKTLCNIAQEASGNIAQEKIFFNDALKYSRVNIAQVDTLYDVALEAPDKNALEKYCLMMP